VSRHATECGSRTGMGLGLLLGCHAMLLSVGLV